jgi:hypothetical protein
MPVTLTVTDNNGAASQPVAHNIRVNTPPNASINGAPATAVTNNSVAFNSGAAGNATTRTTKVTLS